jgi:hypothetical protein
MTPGEIRSEAVRVVDKHYGWTLEFSNTPGMHAREYDEAEAILLRGGVVCPDCDRGVIAPHEVCTHCQLSWENIEAAAAFLGS